MAKTKKTQKGYNEKTATDPQGSFAPDNADENPGYTLKTTANEKLSLPERKRKGEKGNPKP